MGKSIAIKAAIALSAIVLIYSVYWFFRVGQVEKRLNNFVSENAPSVAAQVSVSGFPFSQKITVSDLKFTLPTSVLNKRQVLVKNIVAKASIFSSDFIVTDLTEVTTQDEKGNLSKVEFSKNPDITFSIVNGRIAKFNYKDFGYRVLDKDKNVVYAASNTNVSLDSSVDDNGKITMRILTNIKDVEGFDVMDLYKNAFAQKIIDGLKTGEIALGNANAALIPTQLAVAAPALAAQPAAQVPATEADAIIKKSQELLKQANDKLVKDGNAPIAVPSPAALAASANAPAVIAAPTPTTAPAPAPAAAPAANNATETSAAAPTPVASAPSSVAVQSPTPAPVDNNSSDQQNKALDAVVANNNLVKSNFMMNIEYSLVPLQNQQAQAQFDPTQIQENAAIHYSKSINIVNVEFSNPVYKISFNGEVNIFQDDNLPSGMISVRIEKFDNLLNYMVTSFNKIIDESATDTSADNNSYQNFLKRIVLGLNVVSKELAAKNAVSKDDIAAFDIRREKNLEFLINETTTREILGKF